MDCIIVANSLVKQHELEQLTAHLLAYAIGIAIIIESKPLPRRKDKIFHIDGYKLFRGDRAFRGGGKVAVYASCRYGAYTCPITLVNDDTELMWISLVCCRPTMLVGALYHPHKHGYRACDLDYIEA